MRFPLVALLLVIDPRLEGMPDRFGGPLDERVPEELWTLEAPVHPGLLAAAFGDRRDPRIFLQVGGRGIAFPLFAEGDKQPGGEDGTRPGESLEQGEIRMALSALRDGVIKSRDRLQGDPELVDEGLDEQGMGAITPSSVVKGVAVLMACRRWAITSAERTWWSRKKGSRVERRASGAALRVGQRRKKSQKMWVYLSWNHCRTCGK
jgi:hypothetical protein